MLEMISPNSIKQSWSWLLLNLRLYYSKHQLIQTVQFFSWFLINHSFHVISSMISSVSTRRNSTRCSRLTITPTCGHPFQQGGIWPAVAGSPLCLWAAWRKLSISSMISSADLHGCFGWMDTECDSKNSKVVACWLQPVFGSSMFIVWYPTTCFIVLAVVPNLILKKKNFIEILHIPRQIIRNSKQQVNYLLFSIVPESNSTWIESSRVSVFTFCLTPCAMVNWWSLSVVTLPTLKNKMNFAHYKFFSIVQYNIWSEHGSECDPLKRTSGKWLQPIGW